MNFSLFGKKTHDEEEVTLVLDIGSASVGASFVLLQKKQTPLVLYTTRLPIAVPEKIDEHDFTRSMLTFVTKALENMSTKGVEVLRSHNLKKNNIENVVCVFASPWFASETKVLEIQNKKPVALTEKYVQNLIKKETKSLTERLGIQDEVEIIEQKIISTKLNGYPTPEPYGKKARHVEMNLFLGVVPKSILSAIEEHVHKAFHKDDIVHHSFSLVAFRVITDIFPNDSNSIIFDVTGEVTDISVIENDIVISTSSVPFGRNTLIRRIAKEKKANNDIAVSLLHLYATERAETKLYTEIDAIMADSRTKWRDEIIKSVPNLEEKTIFITADPDVAPIFKKYITVSDPRKIIILNDKHLEGAVVTDTKAKEDVFISTIATFIDTVYQKQK